MIILPELQLGQLLPDYMLQVILPMKWRNFLNLMISISGQPEKFKKSIDIILCNRKRSCLDRFKFERKEDKVKILPPTNLIPEDQMDFAFMELLTSTNAACKYNFDSLMVPFFCVAADMFNNQPVVLRKGDLG